jgi:hypothetical protein
MLGPRDRALRNAFSVHGEVRAHRLITISACRGIGRRAMRA